MKRAAVALLALVLCGRSAGAAECTLGAQRAVIPLRAVTNNLKNGWHVRISVGGGPLHSVQVDTGSRGLAVPRSTIGAAAVDTGKPGQIAYSSSGRILRGEYYMAKVTLEAGAERIETAPMPVLGVERVDCAPGYPRCSPRDRVTALGMAGVGFGRHDSERAAPASATRSMRTCSCGSPRSLRAACTQATSSRPTASNSG